MEELLAKLNSTRADLAEIASGRTDNQTSAVQLNIRAAWLLIALDRYDEAITSAEEANRARGINQYGTVSWEACEAQAVAYLALGQWSEAERAARRALMDLEDQDLNYRLFELAQQAQGRVNPDRIRKAFADPARALAEFDAKRYALGRIQTF